MLNMIHIIALAGCLDQLSLLAKYAFELFDDLHVDCMNSINRIQTMATKVDGITAKLPSIEQKYSNLKAWTYFESAGMSTCNAYYNIS